jgi:hypothetical protein
MFTLPRAGFNFLSLYVLPHECGFEPLHYALRARYRCYMDVIAEKR